jgi:hypothetical protein
VVGDALSDGDELAEGDALVEAVELLAGDGLVEAAAVGCVVASGWPVPADESLPLPNGPHAHSSNNSRSSRIIKAPTTYGQRRRGSSIDGAGAMAGSVTTPPVAAASVVGAAGAAAGRRRRLKRPRWSRVGLDSPGFDTALPSAVIDTGVQRHPTMIT